VVLKDHTDLPPVRWNLAALNTLSVLFIDDHLPTRRSLDKGDQPQQRALACSRMSCDEDHFTFIDGQAESRESLLPTGESLRYVIELDHLNYWSLLPVASNAPTNSSA